MHPEPLVRKAPHVIFNYLIETRRKITDIALLVLGARKFEGGVIAQDVLAYSRLPIVGSWNHSRSGSPCQACDPAGGGGWNPEEIHENRFRWDRVRVCQDADYACFAKNPKNDPRRFIFLDRLVPGRATITVHQCVHAGI